MRYLLLLLVALVAVNGAANAGRNANGSMVVHVYTGQLDYTDTYNFCTDPEFALPGSCLELETQSNDTIDEPTILWLVAAFPPESSPGVTALQFGIRHNLPTNEGYFVVWGACGPSSIELPDSGWPDPSDCGNLVAYSAAVYEHLFKFYWFAVYHGDESTFFGTRTYPSTNEAKFVDDGGPPLEDFCYNFGTVRWGVPGENACPGDHPPGACCLPGGSCLEVAFPVDCEAMGGVWYGELTPCDPNPCPQPGACCFPDGNCQILFAEDCDALGGVFLPDMPCDPNPCGPTPEGACCLDDGTCIEVHDWDCSGVFQGFNTSCVDTVCPPAGACCLDMDGHCETLTADACADHDGTYMGDGSTCEPVNPCFGFPTEKTTWGQIRARFR